MLQRPFAVEDLRSVVTHRRFDLALHIRSLSASRTALPLPRTRSQEIFAEGATSPHVGLADGFLGFTRQCVSDRGGFPSAKIKTRGCDDSRGLRE